jgi:hypothetical protein
MPNCPSASPLATASTAGAEQPGQLRRRFHRLAESVHFRPLRQRSRCRDGDLLV